MNYQLMIFQLILVVFSIGCASGLEKDYVVTAILKKRNLNKNNKTNNFNLHDFSYKNNRNISN